MSHRPKTRRQVLRTAVLLTAGAFAATVATDAHAAVNSFRWCNRCQGMWFINGGNNGHCPVFHLWDHSHYTNGSGIYTIRRATESGRGQPGWHWCQFCKAVWYLGVGENGFGRCPVWPTIGHSPGEPVPDLQRDSFRLETDTDNNGPGGQDNWRWCHKCGCLFFAGNGLAATRCPAGGNHDRTGSANYLLRN
ncbi:hypothetical protein [Allorhizocola rhizosphaerae]|uniref:hypothetical protein n=1 Tax=Allorhizocola rhizosphaerae TaxID=1872709 RepID=UPI000E3C745F|nr:hypothetical protein [Allorhizocola rhizosphaerae]